MNMTFNDAVKAAIAAYMRSDFNECVRLLVLAHDRESRPEGRLSQDERSTVPFPQRRR
jgi:hypothetical protein